MNNTKKLVSVRNLCKYFSIRGVGTLKAVEDVSFDIFEGEILGLVGESGCGKTTLARTIKGLYKADKGQILFEDEDINTFNKKQFRKFTQKAQMIFQDPYSSLNPRMTVMELIKEGMIVHKLFTPEERTQNVNMLLELVGLNTEHATRFPHEFSGGQRQRIGIARALAVNPRFIVCDEPISALDVSIQAQIINLFKELQNKLKLTYLFVAHDLSMVKYISDRVAVMYLGRIVEITSAKKLYQNPLHPYTEFLLSAIPIPDPAIEANRQRIKLDGEMPSPINLPKGCSFKNRCIYADESCNECGCELQEAEIGHFTACMRAGKKH